MEQIWLCDPVSDRLFHGNAFHLQILKQHKHPDDKRSSEHKKQQAFERKRLSVKFVNCSMDTLALVPVLVPPGSSANVQTTELIPKQFNSTMAGDTPGSESPE